MFVAHEFFKLCISLRRLIWPRCVRSNDFQGFSSLTFLKSCLDLLGRGWICAELSRSYHFLQLYLDMCCLGLTTQPLDGRFELPESACICLAVFAKCWIILDRNRLLDPRVVCVFGCQEDSMASSRSASFKRVNSQITFGLLLASR